MYIPLKDLILISSYCDTNEKEDVLRNLVNQIKKHDDYFDLMIVSHTAIPTDISKNANFTIFDKKNEILTEYDLRCKPWFNPADDRAILSIFTGFFNTHLAIWRMMIIGNSVAKNCGYEKVHHLEYDCSISDMKEFYENSNILNYKDCVTYTKKAKTVDDILFGTYQAYKLSSLHQDLYILNEERIKNQIREADDKSPEKMLFELLHHRDNGLIKDKILLDQNDNIFGMSHSKISSGNTAWCLPYHDRLTNKLGFVIWNVEEPDHEIKVTLIYNDEKVVDFGTILPKHWTLRDIDDFDSAKRLIVLLNGKIRNDFDFEKDKESFKKVSYREQHKKI